MITIVVKYNENHNIKGFSIRGHAGFDESGKDIICSAVSVLATNCINSIETMSVTEFESEIKDGFIDFTIKTNVDETADILLQSMLLGLRSVQEAYGKNYIEIIS